MGVPHINHGSKRKRHSAIINFNKNQDLKKKFDKVVIDKDEEISWLKKHSQSLIVQIKKLKSEKKMQQEMVEQLISKESMINKETMNNPIEIEKS